MYVSPLSLHISSASQAYPTSSRDTGINGSSLSSQMVPQGDEITINNDFTVDFETFSKILNRPGGFRDPGEPEEYCRGFQVFDKDMTGFIGVGQLRYILTNLGEKMSDDEVDELLKAVDTSPNGEVNYTGMSVLGCLGYPIRAHYREETRGVG